MTLPPVLRGVAAALLAALALPVPGVPAGSASDALDAARDLASQKKWPEVVATLEEFLRFEPSRPEVDELLGQALAALGRKDEAAHYLGRALADRASEGPETARVRKSLLQCDPLTTRRDALFKKISKDLFQCAAELEATGHAERALEILERLRPIASGAELVAIAAMADEIRSATEQVDLDSGGGERPAAGWPEIAHESEHYRLRAHLEPDVVALLARTMDEIHGFYVQVYFDGESKGIDGRKPTIFVHPSLEAMHERWQGGGPGPAGWWSPGEWVVHCYDTRSDAGSLDGMLETLFHEASHHFMTMLEKGGNTPAWVNEGTATFFEGTSAMADGRVLWPDAARMRLYGLERMLAGDGDQGAPTLVDVISYDQPGSYPGPYYQFGWGLVYFFQQYEDPRTLEYVYRPLYIRYRDEIIGKGSPPRELFERVFLGKASPLGHENLLQFERDWKAWIVERIHPLHFGEERRDLRLAEARRYLAAADAVAKERKPKVPADELRLRALGHLDHVRTEIDGEEQADPVVLLLQADVLDAVGRSSSAAPIFEQLIAMAADGRWQADEAQVEGLAKRLTKLDSRNAPLRLAQARAKGLAKAASNLLGDYAEAKSPMKLRSYTFAKLAADALEDPALDARAAELREAARESGLLRGASFRLEGAPAAWRTIFTNQERVFETSAGRILIEGVRPVGRLCTAVALSGEYDLRARITRAGEPKLGQGHGLVVSGTTSGDWLVVMIDHDRKLHLKRMVLLTKGNAGTSDQGVAVRELAAPPPSDAPFEIAVHVDPAGGTIDVTVAGDGPHRFEAPIALPANGHVGVYAKNGRMLVEDAVVELVP
jgi:hypothetical protein